MPSYSRSSMKECIFDCLAEDQIYNELNYDTLLDCYNKTEENTKDKLKSLVIFDDLQDAFKGECEKLMLRFINNRRHFRTSLMIVAQSYKRISFDVRKALTNHFLFNFSKEDYSIIFDERIYHTKNEWETILKQYRKTNDKKGNFIFLDPELRKCFLNWDEVIFDEDEE